jgi:hypothetical protein
MEEVLEECGEKGGFDPECYAGYSGYLTSEYVGVMENLMECYVENGD